MPTLFGQEIDDQQLKAIALAMGAVRKNPRFLALSPARQEAIEQAWGVLFVNRLTGRQPTWDFVVTAMMMPMSNDEAMLFAEEVDRHKLLAR